MSHGPQRSIDDRKQADYWRVGTASAVITPEESMWMSGWATRKNPSQGIEQDLHVKVVAIEDASGNRCVIGSLELLCIPGDLRTSIFNRCRERHELAFEDLLLNATHTHCGPVIRPERAQFYDLNADQRQQIVTYRKRIEDTVVDTIDEAISSLDPATLSYGSARCAFGMNRRLPTVDGIDNAPNPDGPVDTDVPVLVTQHDDDVRAIIFSYACHTTTMTGHLKFGGDWAGYAQTHLEDRYPNATALFVTGCAGDQNPYPRGSVTLAKQHGRTLANAVETAMIAELTPAHGPLRTLYDEQPVAFEGAPSPDKLKTLLDSDRHRDRVRARSLLDELEETGEIQLEYPYPIQVVGFGSDLTLVALAGEVTVEYGLSLKEEVSGSMWVLGYSNDDFTYVPTTDAIYEGGYEGGQAIEWTTYPGTLQTDVEERILTTARSLSKRVSGP